MNCIPNKSRGVALLTTLLVVTIATIMTVSFIKRQWIDIKKTQNTQRLEQSWLYAQGVEAWAIGRLQDDMEKNAVDSQQDGWSYPIEPTDIEGGQLSAKISDYQGRFNINNLLATQEEGEKYQERFRRLLNVLELPEELIDSLVDWIDADSDINYPGGAEESHYMTNTPAYLPANKEMVDISELKLVKGFTEEVYKVLEPHVSALPGIVNINVNTATEAVLQSLGSEISQQDAQFIIETREETPFEGVESFIQHQALAGRNIVAEGLSVSSQYFAVDSDILMDQLQLGYKSIIFRKDKSDIKVVQRTKRGYFGE